MSVYLGVVFVHRFFFDILIAEAAQGKSPISCQDLILAGRSHFKKNYTSS